MTEHVLLNFGSPDFDLPDFFLANFDLPDCAPHSGSHFIPDFIPDANRDPAPPSPPSPPSRPDRERLKIILIGSAEGIREMIHRLQQCRVAEVGDWSRLLPAPNAFTPDPAELMSILVLYRRRGR